ncbi:hypothetical protein MG293_006423 [Ovis ammon polii]|uniref:Uncharacterized protein n=1 Tax=Ovis ammon polii TaxID=230172 RepID=A0AAD4UF99_OVIAM|nr:hypothetical protein MG293_006423 [Ovis ammon polii]
MGYKFKSRHRETRETGVYDYAKPKRREKEESPTLTPSRVAGKRKGEKLSENLEPELPSKVGMKKQRWTAQVDEGNAGQQYRKRIKYPTYPRVTNELRLPTFFHLHHFQQTTGKQHIVKHQVSRRGLAVAYGRWEDNTGSSKTISLQLLLQIDQACTHFLSIYVIKLNKNDLLNANHSGLEIEDLD